MRFLEQIKKAVDRAPSFSLSNFFKDNYKGKIRGDVFITLQDAVTGEVQERREIRNLIVTDCSVMVARLLKDPAEPWHGFYALAVGTGDVGWDPMAPPAATVTQRSLYSEICRKTFTVTQFIDGAGVPTAIPTNVVDYTCTYVASEAVGPLVEMGVVCGNLSNNMSKRNSILPPNGPYDPTVNQTSFESIGNYLCFPVINKPATSNLTIVWRITT